MTQLRLLPAPDSPAPRPLRVLCVLGTRPEAIKMAPVIHQLARFPGELDCQVCVTGQHRELADDVLERFAITPDHDLDVMRAGQSPTGVAARVLAGLEPVLAEARPDWVLVQGDTTTAAMAGLAAFYAGARVAHVEAGLRSHEPRAPFPEEVNRRIAAVVADLHFAPTPAARANLLRENVPERSVLVTGNTVIDALELARRAPGGGSPLVAALPRAGRLLVVTAHRRENLGAPLEGICDAVFDLVDRFADLHVAVPLHPNPAARQVVEQRLGGRPRITLLPPLGYCAMVELLDRACILLTDSGGLQEEAPSLGTPVLVLRDVTERQEGIAAGTARLVGTDRGRIVDEATTLLCSPGEHALMARAVNPYGDGQAAMRIVDALRGCPVEQWRPPAAQPGPRRAVAARAAALR